MAEWGYSAANYDKVLAGEFGTHQSLGIGLRWIAAQLVDDTQGEEIIRTLDNDIEADAFAANADVDYSGFLGDFYYTEAILGNRNEVGKRNDVIHTLAQYDPLTEQNKQDALTATWTEADYPGVLQGFVDGAPEPEPDDYQQQRREDYLLLHLKRAKQRRRAVLMAKPYPKRVGGKYGDGLEHADTTPAERRLGRLINNG